MAKVRIQARSADAEDAVEHRQQPPPPHTYHHAHSKHVGALDILKRVWKREGFFGWYQVRPLHFRFLAAQCSRDPLIGYASADYQSCSVPGCIVRVQGTIRALGITHHGLCCTVFRKTIMRRVHLYTPV